MGPPIRLTALGPACSQLTRRPCIAPHADLPQPHRCEVADAVIEVPPCFDHHGSRLAAASSATAQRLSPRSTSRAQSATPWSSPAPHGYRTVPPRGTRPPARTPTPAPGGAPRHAGAPPALGPATERPEVRRESAAPSAGNVRVSRRRGSNSLCVWPQSTGPGAIALSKGLARTWDMPSTSCRCATSCTALPWRTMPVVATLQLHFVDHAHLTTPPELRLMHWAA